jgi:hypothetical protein
VAQLRLVRPMKVTDVWHAALVRLGTDPTSAHQIIAVISSCASSPSAWDAWNSRFPDGAGRALIRGIDAPDGATLAQQLVDQFRTRLMDHFGVSEAEVQQLLSGIGRN